MDDYFLGSVLFFFLKSPLISACLWLTGPIHFVNIAAEKKDNSMDMQKKEFEKAVSEPIKPWTNIKLLYSKQDLFFKVFYKSVFFSLC